jgi:hypothetical protein
VPVLCRHSTGPCTGRAHWYIASLTGIAS